MQSIKFDEGYKEFAINGDENRILRFNPGDWAIMERINKVEDKLKKIEKEFEENKEEDIAKVVAETDAKIKEQFNYLINVDNAADVVFGGQSPLNKVGDSYLFVKVIEALVPFIKEEVEKEAKESKKRVGKYTGQYE